MSDEPKKGELERLKAEMAVNQKREAARLRAPQKTLLGGVDDPEKMVAEIAAQQKPKARDAFIAAAVAAKTTIVDPPIDLPNAEKPEPKRLPVKASKQDMEVTDHYHTRLHPSGLAASLENTILAIAELRIVARYD